MLPPLLIDLLLSEFTRLFFHPLTFFSSILLNKEVLKTDILIIHQFSFFPFSKAVFVVLSLIASKVVLDLTDLTKTEFVETEFEIDHIGVDVSSCNPFISAFLIHLAVGHVQAH